MKGDYAQHRRNDKVMAHTTTRFVIGCLFSIFADYLLAAVQPTSSPAPLFHIVWLNQSVLLCTILGLTAALPVSVILCIHMER